MIRPVIMLSCLAVLLVGCGKGKVQDTPNPPSEAVKELLDLLRTGESISVAINCHPERSEGSGSIARRSFAALRMTVIDSPILSYTRGEKNGTNFENVMDEVGHWGKIGQATYAITDENDQRDAVVRIKAFVCSKEHDENAVLFCKRGIWALSCFPQLASDFTPLLHNLEKSNDKDIAKFAQQTLSRINQKPPDGKR